MNKNIVIVGSSNTDMIIKAPRIPKPGETIIGGDFSTAAGGKGANQAVAAARSGGDVTFVACIGNDMLGKQAIEGFEKEHINTGYIKVDNSNPSGVALIFVDDQGENSIAVASGANAKLAPEDLQKSQKCLDGAAVLVAQLETPLPTIQEAFQLAADRNILTILNPAPAQPLDSSLLKNVSILTPNETETELLTGIPVTDESSAQKAADVLMGKGVNTVIITLGKKGAYVIKHDRFTHISSFKVKAVDSTAAGDIFNGALAVALARDQKLNDAIVYASAAAALSVTKLGAQPSAPTQDEIEAFLLSHKNEINI